MTTPFSLAQLLGTSACSPAANRLRVSRHRSSWAAGHEGTASLLPHIVISEPHTTKVSVSLLQRQ